MNSKHCDICGKFVNHRYLACSTFHDEISGDLKQEEEDLKCQNLSTCQ